MKIIQKIANAPNTYLLAVIGAILAASAWTFVRFFDQPPTFDLVGQQLLASQWIHGMHAGAFVGPTNYILKILFIYIPFNLVPFSALTNLIIMTVLVNALAFAFIAAVLKRLWQELYPNSQSRLALPLLYLGLISGSVFWIQFSNSRNLEVAGGLFLTCLCLRTWRRPSWQSYVCLSLFASLLFFADPLQIYMSFLPALVFIFGRLILHGFNQPKIYISSSLLASGGVGFLISKALIKLVGQWLNVKIDSHPPSTSVLSPHQWIDGIKSTVSQVGRLYAGGFEAGRVREAVDLLTLLAVILIGLYCLWKRPKTRSILGFAGVVWAVNILIYIASNQANQPGTSRYLIMTVPVFILAAGVVIQNLPKTKVVLLTITGILTLNAVTLAGVFWQKWDPHFSEYNHGQAAANYAKNNNYKYGYAGMDTAIIADYLSKNKVNILPLGCQPDSTLRPATLFFDKAGFNINKTGARSVPLFLDGNSITNVPSVCDIPHISSQFGAPQKNDQLQDGSRVLLYSPNHISF